MRLSDVYPWGRNLAEYSAIFNLVDEDLHRSLASFADGTSSVNSELKEMGHRMVSIDPLYGFNVREINQRLGEVVRQSEIYQQELPPEEQRQAEDIVRLRAEATKIFLDDFELGKEQSRYLAAALPGPFSFGENTFGIGLCAHFLLLYDYYGLSFHISAITEMLRICEEIRIYPTVNLDGQKSLVLDDIIGYFSEGYQVRLEAVDYGFQDLGKEMLRISREDGTSTDKKR